MIRITVSATTRSLLEAHTPTGRMSESGSSQLPDGRWEVDIDEDVAEVLAHIHQDPDTAIRQLLAAGRA